MKKFNFFCKVLQLLERGNNRRSQSATGANANSSRSHAVLQVLISSRGRDGETYVSRKAKLSLVDLAGSERAAKTNNRGKVTENNKERERKSPKKSRKRSKEKKA